MLPEAKEKLLGEMKAVFAARFEVNEEKRVAVEELLCVFESSRGEMTESERNLFNRHSKRLFLDLWPHSDWDANSEIPCYYHMSASPEVVEVSTDDEPVMAKKRPYTMGGKRVARPPDAKSHESMLTEELKMEMRRVFSENFEVKPGALMHFNELPNAFTASRNARGVPVSDEEASLLHRHGKKYFMEQWPHTIYRPVKKVYRYTNVARKTTGTFFLL